MIPNHRPYGSFSTVIALLIVSVVLATSVAAQTAETPRRGGVLLAVIGADPPSLDPHQESTFATLQPMAPLYSTLLQIDPYSYPKIIGDAATEWRISPDGVTYTFKIRQGIRFHDGSPLTAADVKATYDKIVFPPKGVRSIRQSAYSAISAIEASDPATVVFKLKFPSASLLGNLASPWNVIYPKKYLDKDPNYFKANVMGSGPFKFKSYTRGSTFEGQRNPDYFVKDRPYLDGYKFWYAEGRDQGNFELVVLPTADFMDDPDLFLFRYTTGASQNWGRFTNPAVDDLFARQARTLDPAERRKLVHEVQKIVLENAYYMPGLWWRRNVVHWAKVKNYVAGPSHFTNQKLQDVWLAED